MLRRVQRLHAFQCLPVTGLRFANLFQTNARLIQFFHSAVN